MIEANDNTVIFLIPIASTIALGAFFSVVGFARERRKEREALYRHETARALVEKDRMSADDLAKFLREEAARPHRARIESVKLWGVVCALAGLGLVVGVRTADEMPVHGIGWMPFGVGIGALLYAYVLARREP